EAGRSVALGQRADHQVELLDAVRIVAVNRLQLLADIRVVGKIVETLDRIQPQLAAKLVIPGHATFARPHDVDSAHVEERIARDTELLHEARKVVEYQGSGVLV